MFRTSTKDVAKSFAWKIVLFRAGGILVGGAYLIVAFLGPLNYLSKQVLKTIAIVKSSLKIFYKLRTKKL